MHASRVGRRAASALAGILIAGAASLAAVPANAASPVPDGQANPTHAQPAHHMAWQHPRGKVVARLPLSIRERATTDSRYLGSLRPGSIVELRCKKRGQNVDGNDLWYKLENHRGYSAARYIQNLSHVPWC
ncbi:SH3 domain-containing protein [Streptomyces montanisoli]|uniref:SH3 domain-containing protein n=1 Tax=Streptomyces montanisoli TaxID=2798581 RepID=A0A940MGL2_9ACTN|nr:SH3 domain-containing protein [Streptomyces montanisoli]MBP0459926.1 SH3 domain-containing protein [Streptomyces montanisoli]